jgi:hypothetical protein
MIQGIHGIHPHFQSLVFSEANTFEKVQVQTDFSGPSIQTFSIRCQRSAVTVIYAIPGYS